MLCGAPGQKAKGMCSSGVQDLGVLTYFGLEIKSCLHLCFHENVVQIKYLNSHLPSLCSPSGHGLLHSSDSGPNPLAWWL